MQPHATLRICATIPSVDTIGPEATTISYDRLGVDDVRSLHNEIHRRSVSGAERHVCIIARFITHEAQNALLKLLEEPPDATRIEIIIPEGLSLLPTVMSRFVLVTRDDQKHDSELFNEFLHASYRERIERIEAINKQKDTVAIMSLKSGLIEYLKDSSPDNNAELRSLEYVARYLATRGASNKMLLDELSLVLPVRS